MYDHIVFSERLLLATEVWALMYALTKNSWETPFGETLQKISDADMTKLGLDSAAVLARRAAINVTTQTTRLLLVM